MAESGPTLRDKELLIQQELAKVPASDDSRPPVPRDIRDVLDYVDGHLFDEGLNVDAIRRACSLRNHNVSSRFKLVIGVSIRDYIERRRMEVADRLLGNPNLEIYLISASLGYAHQESFSRAFRRCFGRTPSEHRSLLSTENGGGDEEDELSRFIVKSKDQDLTPD